MQNPLKTPILACSLNGPNSQPLELTFPGELQQSAQRLSEQLLAEFERNNIELPTRCWVQIQLRDGLDPADQAPSDRHSHSLEQVLKGLAGEVRAKAEGKSYLEGRLLKMFPELQGTPEMERLVKEAMEFSARGIGLAMASQPTELDRETPKVRRKIFSCPECDEVFIDATSLENHRKSHRATQMLVFAEFELLAAQEVSLTGLLPGVQSTWTRTSGPGWEWRLEGRSLLRGNGGPGQAKVELEKLLSQPGLPWLGDAVLQKHLFRMEVSYPGLLHHSLWNLGLSLRDVRRVVQRLHQAGYWTDWLSFLEMVPEAILLCREQAPFPAGPLPEANLEQLVAAIIQLSSNDQARF
ncbi:C2H2-type zinc finger protein [bacterium]|nr:C2H2-type zinc finger protein [bacterium]